MPAARPRRRALRGRRRPRLRSALPGRRREGRRDHLAFDLALDFTGRAIAIGGTDLDDVSSDASWPRSSRAPDAIRAGEVFERAAALAGLPARPRTQSPFFHKRAVEQYFESGLRSWRLTPSTHVLRRLGLELPKTRRATLVKVIANRCSPLPAASRSSSARFRGAACRARSARHHPVAGGDRRPHRLPPIVAGSPCARRWVGENRRSRTRFERVRDWAPRPADRAARSTGCSSCSGSSALRPTRRHRAGYRHCRGLIGWFRGDYLAAFEDLDRAMRLFRRDSGWRRSSRPPGLPPRGAGPDGRVASAPSELATASATRRTAATILHDLAAASRPSRGWRRPPRARRCAERIARSARPKAFSIPHYQPLITRSTSRSTRTMPLAPCEQIEAAWPLLERNLSLSMSWTRDELAHLRARAALAAAEALAKGATGSPRDIDDCLAIARR